jgi:iron(III) transport system substrate-binding protein
MAHSRVLRFIGLLLVVALFAAACGDDDDDTATGAGNSETTTTAASGSQAGDNGLDALVAAAKKEGSVTFYSAATENVAKRAADAFQKEYGIKTQYIRFPSQQLQQRYAAEAQSGNFAADLILNAGNSIPYAEEGIQKGWIQSISEAKLPVIESGKFPEKYNNGPTAVVQIGPWLVTYNTNKVKDADVPKDWNDLLDPKWKGQILIPNPASSDAYVDFWALLLDEYGAGFFDKLRAQEPRHYDSGVPAVQALGAGEGAFEVPAVPAQVQATQAQGAPLGTKVIDLTVGVEIQVALTSPDKAKHPNAARLFANYIMSEAGNKILNDDPGSISVYDTSKLPAKYHSPSPERVAKKDQVIKLLGF